MSNILISSCTKIKYLWVTWLILPERMFTCFTGGNKSLFYSFSLSVRCVWHVCGCVHEYLFFFWSCRAVGLIITFSIFLSSLSQRNFSLGLSLLVKDYSGRQWIYCQRYLEGEKNNTNGWQCTDLNPHHPVMKLNLVFFSLGNGLSGV